MPRPRAWTFVSSRMAPPPDVPASRADEERARLLTGRARNARFRAEMAMVTGDWASAAASEEVIVESEHELAVLRSVRHFAES